MLVDSMAAFVISADGKTWWRYFLCSMTAFEIVSIIVQIETCRGLASQ